MLMVAVFTYLKLYYVFNFIIFSTDWTVVVGFSKILGHCKLFAFKLNICVKREIQSVLGEVW